MKKGGYNMQYLIKETKRASYENRDYPPTYETVEYWGKVGIDANPKRVRPFDTYDDAGAVLRAIIHNKRWIYRDNYNWVFTHEIISIGG